MAFKNQTKVNDIELFSNQQPTTKNQSRLNAPHNQSVPSFKDSAQGKG